MLLFFLCFLCFSSAGNEGFNNFEAAKISAKTIPKKQKSAFVSESGNRHLYEGEYTSISLTGNQAIFFYSNYEHATCSFTSEPYPFYFSINSYTIDLDENYAYDVSIVTFPSDCLEYVIDNANYDLTLSSTGNFSYINNQKICIFMPSAYNTIYYFNAPNIEYNYDVLTITSLYSYNGDSELFNSNRYVSLDFTTQYPFLAVWETDSSNAGTNYPGLNWEIKRAFSSTIETSLQVSENNYPVISVSFSSSQVYFSYSSYITIEPGEITGDGEPSGNEPNEPSTGTEDDGGSNLGLIIGLSVGIPVGLFVLSFLFGKCCCDADCEDCCYIYIYIFLCCWICECIDCCCPYGCDCCCCCCDGCCDCYDCCCCCCELCCPYGCDCCSCFAGTGVAAALQKINVGGSGGSKLPYVAGGNNNINQIAANPYMVWTPEQVNKAGDSIDIENPVFFDNSTGVLPYLGTEDQPSFTTLIKYMSDHFKTWNAEYIKEHKPEQIVPPRLLREDNNNNKEQD